MLIAICTKNPVKIKAAVEAFKLFFDDFSYLTFDLKGNPAVSVQPMSKKETIHSAFNRIRIVEEEVEADFYVALEGGVDQDEYGAYLTGYVVIQRKDGKHSLSGGYRMPLPSNIMEKLRNKEETELGFIIDKISGIENSKQKDGAIGLFTQGHLKRKDAFQQMVILALIPFVSSIYQKIDENIR
ncbi:MAG: DUF84 family protein [Candidatus Heimdallarchaeaceae archaeon]